MEQNLVKNYLNPGITVTYTNAGSTIASGGVVDLGSRVGIAENAIPNGHTGRIYMDGVFQLPAITTFAAGTALYWDGSKVVSTASTNTPVGVAVDAEDPKSGFVAVRLQSLSSAGGSSVGGEAIEFSDYSGSPTAGTQTVIQGPSKAALDTTDGTFIRIAAGDVQDDGATAGGIILAGGQTPTSGRGLGNIILDSGALVPLSDGNTSLGNSGLGFGGAYINNALRNTTDGRVLEMGARQLKKSGNAVVMDFSGSVVPGAKFPLGINVTTVAPASASATGVAGDIAFDNDYMYRCIATDTWVRVLLETW